MEYPNKIGREDVSSSVGNTKGGVGGKVTVDGVIRLSENCTNVDYGTMYRELTFVDAKGNTHLLWENVDGNVLLPRNYPIPLLSGETASIPIPEVPKLSPRVTSKIVLRSDVQKEAVAALSVPGDKTLVLGCGRGKTVVALHSVVSRGMFPVLVVVPTEPLADQWEARIKEHLDLGASKVGRIQGKVLRLSDSFTIAILNTASLKELPDHVYRYFAMVIFDEVHRLGAVSLGACSRRFVGERLSLTATLDRDDGLHNRIIHHIGPVVYENRTHDLVPKVFFVRTGISLNEAGYTWNGRLNIAKMMNGLCSNKDRNDLILKTITSAVGKGRTCLVLGERIKQLETLLAKLNKLGIDAGLFTGKRKGERKSDVYQRRDKAMASQVTLATSILAKEGLDRSAFDTVFLTIPFGGKGRLEQTAGRALRELQGKKNPILVVFVDYSYRDRWIGHRKEPVHGFMYRVAHKMRSHMLSLGYEVSVVR